MCKMDQEHMWSVHYYTASVESESSVVMNEINRIQHSLAVSLSICSVRHIPNEINSIKEMFNKTEKKMLEKACSWYTT